jgi:hypothetical protein
VASEKKWMAIMVEVETYDGEVQSILPVDAETAEYFSTEELKKIYEYIRFADDASFDFMWDFRGLVSDAISEQK